MKYSFKVRYDEFEEMASAPGIIPAPYLARHKWVLVEEPSRLRRDEWEHYVRRPYDLIRAELSKKLAKAHGLL